MTLFSAGVITTAALADTVEGTCPGDVCIPGFLDAQGGHIEMLSEPSDFDPGRVQCTIDDSGNTLTFFDPNHDTMVKSEQLGSSRSADLDCQRLTPVGTTGISVSQCTIKTQFSKVGADRTLRRQRLTLKLTYPFLGEPYASAVLADLIRNDQRDLVEINHQRFTRTQMDCGIENYPGQSQNRIEHSSEE